MNTLSLFNIINRGNSYWRGKNKAFPVIVSAFIVLILGIAFGEYYGFRYILHTLEEDPFFKNIIISFSFHAIFAILFSLIVASALIISPILFLKNRYDNFLLSLPIKTHTIFSARFITQLILLGWTAIIFGMPIILAIGINTHASFSFYLIAVIYLALLIVLAGAISNALLLLIIAVTKNKIPRLTTLISLAGAALFFYALVRTVTPHNLVPLLLPDNQSHVTALVNITTQFRYWPSTWYADSVLPLVNGTALSTINFLILPLVTIAVFLIQYLLAVKFYRSALQETQESREKKPKKNSFLIKLSGAPMLLVRQWAQVARTRNDINQLFLFILLFLMYLGFIANSPNLGSTPDPVWTPRIIFFLLLVVVYFIILMALRFAFPFASLSANLSWFNLSLPRFRARSYSSHIMATFLPIAIILEVIIFFTSRIMQFSASFTTPMLIITPILCLTIITLITAVGSVFPASHNINPETMSTTPSGLLALVVANIYALLAIAALWKEASNAITGGHIGINIGSLYLIALLSSLLLTIIFWRIGQSAFRHLRLA